MTPRIASILAVAVLATVAVSAQSPPQSPPALQSLAPVDLDAFISRVVAEQQAIGVTVGVMQDGKVIFNKGFGLASTRSNTPISTLMYRSPDGKIEEFLFSRR